MAAIPGTVIPASIVPTDSADTYPTHNDKYGRGGFRVVADSTERDAISEDRQKVGMLVRVQDTGLVYELTAVGTPGTWSQWSDTIAGASPSQVLFVDIDSLIKGDAHFTFEKTTNTLILGQPGGPEGYGYGYGEEGASTGSLVLYGDLYVDNDAIFAEDVIINGSLTIDGKLTVTGLIDPTGLQLTPVLSNPGVTANTVWLDSGNSNRWTFDNLMYVSNTTASTSSTTGALVVAGGVGIAGTLVPRGGTADGSANTIIGASPATPVTQTVIIGDLAGAALSTSSRDVFVGYNARAAGDSDDVVVIGANSSAGSGSSGSNGAIAIGSSAAAGFIYSVAIGRSASATKANQMMLGNATYITEVNIPATTTSSSTTTGALVVAGGIGVGDAGFFGGEVNATAAYRFIGTNNVIVGNGCTVSSGSNAISLGLNADCDGGSSNIAIGNGASTLPGTAPGVAVGHIALGLGALAGGTTSAAGSCIALGPDAVARGGNSISIGASAINSGPGTYQIAIGDAANAGSANNTIALGRNTSTTASDTVAIGRSASAGTVGYIVLGASSVHTRVVIPMTSTSTSTTTGALVVAGGVGVTGNIYIGGNANIAGKLTVGGLIDPTGLELTPVAANPGGTPANTLWVNSSDSNKLYFGASEVGGGSGSNIYRNSFTNASLVGGVLSVNHALGVQYVVVQVYDENEQLVGPDNITLIDSNNLTIDFGSFGVISGTWNLVIAG